MSIPRWKRQEREIARSLGTERLPDGEAGRPDCRLPGWAIHIKTRATAPAWLWRALDQAARDSGEGEYPAVILSHVSQGKKARRVVLLDFAHFRALVAGEEAVQGEGKPE
jgi:hypothetical protein